MAKMTMWQRMKDWWITNDPDDLAREEFLLTSQRRELIADADRLATSVARDEAAADHPGSVRAS